MRECISQDQHKQGCCSADTQQSRAESVHNDTTTKKRRGGGGGVTGNARTARQNNGIGISVFFFMSNYPTGRASLTGVSKHRGSTPQSNSCLGSQVQNRREYWKPFVFSSSAVTRL